MKIGVVGACGHHNVGLGLSIVDPAAREQKIGHRDAGGEVGWIQIHGVLQFGIGFAELAHMQINLRHFEMRFGIIPVDLQCVAKLNGRPSRHFPWAL